MLKPQLMLCINPIAHNSPHQWSAQLACTNLHGILRSNCQAVNHELHWICRLVLHHVQHQLVKQLPDVKLFLQFERALVNS